MQKTMAKYTKRRDKRGYEWKSAYREKEALMLERGYPEVSPHDFYRELFPAGSLQQEPEDGKGNIIATQIRPSGKGRTRQWVIDDSLKMLDKVIGDRFGLIPPISFYGKSHTKENAHELFAVVVDVDYVGKQQLKNLLKQFGNGVQLRPTYLVSSGKGVHLYYFLQEPVQLYRNREEVLAELKEAFIRRLWNDTSSIRPDSPDITGIYQGFRCVGSQSKLGVDFPVKAYKLSENRYTLEDIKAKQLLKISGSVGCIEKRPLEVTIINQSDIVPLQFPPKCQYMYGEWLRGEMEAGEYPQACNDPDIMILLWQARKNSITLKGAESKELIPAIPFHEIKKAIRFSLPGLISSFKGDERNVLLTLSRMWFTLVTEEITTKDVAAKWVILKLPERFPPLLTTAKEAYLGNLSDEWETVEKEAMALVEYMKKQIEELLRTE